MAFELTDAAPAAVAVAPRRRRWLSLAAKAAIGSLIAIMLAIGAIGLLLDTDLGHRLILDRIAALAPESGLRIRIGRIEGSIWGRTELRDVRLYDPEGLFAEAPVLEVEWQPLAWLADRLLIHEVETELAILHRLPAFVEADTGEPTIPDYDISIGRLEIAQLRIDEAVAGTRRVARVSGEAEFRRGRALLDLDATMRGGGDRVALLLDSEPGRDQFDLDLRLDAPAGGVFARMLGTAEPLLLEVSGDGSWREWAGTARLDLSGRRAGDLRLLAESGRYGASGWLAPAMLGGRLGELGAPRLLVAARGTFEEGVLAGTLSGRSAALRVAVSGAADLRGNLYRDLRVAAELSGPTPLLADVTGAGRLTFILDGPFDDASLAYRLDARRLSFGAASFEDVRASGSGRWRRGRAELPIAASARRVTGIGEPAARMLADPRLNGALVVQGQRLSADGLALASDRLRGRLGLVADFATGRTVLSGTAAMDAYPVPGIGLVDLRAELRGASAGRGMTLSGTASGAVRRLDNATLRWAARGLPRIETGIASGPGGLAFPNLRFSSPALQLSGAGRQRPDGSFSFDGSGRQADLGSLALRLDGTADRPRIALRLARPWPALALSNVTVEIEPQPQGFAYRTRGGSALGPFSARGAVAARGGRPILVRVASLDLSGASGSGVLRPEGGGVGGRLDLRGLLSGPLLFAAADGSQRVEADLVAVDARLGALPLGSGRLSGFVLSGAGGELGGALRFDGAADRLSELAGVRLGGPLALTAQLGGTVAEPRVRGTVRLENGRLANTATGTTLEGLDLNGSFDGPRLTVESLSGSTPGGGRISGRGTIVLGGDVDLRFEARQALIIARSELRARVTGRIAVRSQGGGGLISGDLRLVDSAISTSRQPGGVSGGGESGRAPWRLALRISGGDLAVRGRGLDSAWRPDLRVGGTLAQPRIAGSAELVRGRYQFIGRPFDLSSGTLFFEGESPPDPRLDIVARSGAGPAAAVRITGRASRPVVAVTSPF